MHDRVHSSFQVQPSRGKKADGQLLTKFELNRLYGMVVTAMTKRKEPAGLIKGKVSSASVSCITQKCADYLDHAGDSDNTSTCTGYLPYRHLRFTQC